MTDPIRSLQGRTLSSVEFVHDYLQLRFDGPCLTVNAVVTVIRDGQEYRQGAVGFRDRVCERIGKEVRQAFTLIDEYIQIEFDDASIARISLTADDRSVPEAAVLTENSGPIYVW